MHEMSAADLVEQDLIEAIAGCEHDPLRYVLLAYPWTEIGTQLENESGPRLWQVQELNAIRDALADGATKPPAEMVPFMMSVASGHGVGKSALVSWLIGWAMSTKENCRGVVTANTEAQLRTKTWPEVRKWHGMSINAHWFTCAATSIHAKGDQEKTWRIDAIPWSENNTEAFAGLHNKGSRILLLFDEASAISDKVWEVAEGALTDEGTEIIWCAFGNPTRNSGRFRETCGRMAHRWRHSQVDSRTVPGTNKVQIAKWIADYGEDSDFVRVRVRGMFPRAGSMQLISGEIVTEAMTREPHPLLTDPLAMGIDVSRFGGDEATIYFRRGRDARTIKATFMRNTDTMTLAAKAAELIEKHKPDAIFVDETGIGGAVIDRLRQLGYTVIGVNNGAKSDWSIDGMKVNNKGAEMWVRGRQWLETGGAIENDPDLEQQLTGREYGYNNDNAILLEKKDDMRDRGLSSPDRADGLFLTLAYPIAAKPAGGALDRARSRVATLARPGTYNPHARR